MFTVRTFTFQSGDIQIKLGTSVIKNLLQFTFQSGDIQIKQYEEIIRKKEENLHSNLVIFKFV